MEEKTILLEILLLSFIFLIPSASARTYISDPVDQDYPFYFHDEQSDTNSIRLVPKDGAESTIDKKTYMLGGVGDFDGDGEIELAERAQNSDYLRFYDIQTMSEDFTASYKPKSGDMMFPANIDGDNQTDIIYKNANDGNFKYYDKNDGENDLTCGNGDVVNGEIGGDAIDMADFDGDGYEELLHTDGSQALQYLHFHSNDPDGTCSETDWYSSGSTSKSYSNVADFDGDGNVGVAFGTGDNAEFKFYDGQTTSFGNNPTGGVKSVPSAAVMWSGSPEPEFFGGGNSNNMVRCSNSAGCTDNVDGQDKKAQQAIVSVLPPIVKEPSVNETVAQGENVTVKFNATDWGGYKDIVDSTANVVFDDNSTTYNKSDSQVTIQEYTKESNVGGDDMDGGYVPSDGKTKAFKASFTVPESAETGQWNVTVQVKDEKMTGTKNWTTFNVELGDKTPPSYSKVGYNVTDPVVAGEIVETQVYWQDNSSNLSTGMLYHNTSGSMVQTGKTSWGSTNKSWYNTTINTSGEGGKTVCWKQYANDTVGNLNETMNNSSNCFRVINEYSKISAQEVIIQRQNGLQNQIERTVDKSISITENQKMTGLITRIGNQQFDLGSITADSARRLKTLIQGLPAGTDSDRVTSIFNTISQSTDISDTIFKFRRLPKNLGEKIPLSEESSRVTNIFRTKEEGFRIEKSTFPYRRVPRLISQNVGISTSLERLASILEIIGTQIKPGAESEKSSWIVRNVGKRINTSLAISWEKIIPVEERAAGQGIETQTSGLRSLFVERRTENSLNFRSSPERLIDVYRVLTQEGTLGTGRSVFSIDVVKSIQSFQIEDSAFSLTNILRTGEQGVGLDTTTPRLINIFRTGSASLVPQTSTERVFTIFKTGSQGVGIGDSISSIISILRKESQRTGFIQKSSRHLFSSRISGQSLEIRTPIQRLSSVSRYLSQPTSLKTDNFGSRIVPRKSVQSLALSQVSERLSTVGRTIENPLNLNRYTLFDVPPRDFLRKTREGISTEEGISVFRRLSDTGHVSIGLSKSVFNFKKIPRIVNQPFKGNTNAQRTMLLSRVFSRPLNLKTNARNIKTISETLKQPFKINILQGKDLSASRFIEQNLRLTQTSSYVKTLTRAFDQTLKPKTATNQISELFRIKGQSITGNTIAQRSPLYLRTNSEGINTGFRTDVFRTLPISLGQLVSLRTSTNKSSWISRAGKEILGIGQSQTSSLNIKRVIGQKGSLSTASNAFKFNIARRTLGQAINIDKEISVFKTIPRVIGQPVEAGESTSRIVSVFRIVSHPLSIDLSQWFPSPWWIDDDDGGSSGSGSKETDTEKSPGGPQKPVPDGNLSVNKSLSSSEIELISYPVMEELTGGEDREVEITVANTGDHTGTLDITLEGQKPDWVSIPEEAELEAGEKKKIKISLSPPTEASSETYRMEAVLRGDSVIARKPVVIHLKESKTETGGLTTKRRATVSKKEKETEIRFTIKNPTQEEIYRARIVEEIPKTFASEASKIDFSREPSEIIEEDPVVSWEFLQISPGESIEISYSTPDTPENLTKLRGFRTKKTISKTKLPGKLEVSNIKLPELEPGKEISTSLRIKSHADEKRNLSLEIESPSNLTVKPENIETVIKKGATKNLTIKAKTPEDLKEGEYSIEADFRWGDSLLLKEYSVSVRNQRPWKIYTLIVSIVLITLAAVAIKKRTTRKKMGGFQGFNQRSMRNFKSKR